MASSLFDSFYYKNMFSTPAMAAVFSDEVALMPGSPLK